jgi:hypothetical protein
MGAQGTGLLCPSAQPDMEGAQVLGVVDRQSGEPRLSYLNGMVPVTPELLDASGAVPPLAVMRLAARCEQQRCTHFDGSACTLAVRIVENLEQVCDALPPCAIRRNCRWYAEQGQAACFRCPQIVTRSDRANVEPALLQGATGAPL